MVIFYAYLLSSKMVEYIEFSMPKASKGDPVFITKSDELYVIARPSMSSIMQIKFLPEAHLETVRLVQDDTGKATQYAADNARVYYVGGETILESTLLEGVSPESFVILSGERSLAKSDKFVYFYDRVLYGLDPQSVVLREDGVLYDLDGTVWYPSGDCHFFEYTEGTLEDIDAWVPSCS